MKKILIAICLPVVASIFAGCGSSTSAPSPEGPPPEVTSDAQLKERLEFIAKNGGMGSAFAGIEELCKKTGKDDLVTSAQELAACQDSESAKTIAQGMLDKL